MGKAKGIGPQPVTIQTVTCSGCRYLKLEEWAAMHSEGCNKGVFAKCDSVDGAMIGDYEPSMPPPKWCPLRAAIDPAIWPRESPAAKDMRQTLDHIQSWGAVMRENHSSHSAGEALSRFKTGFSGPLP